jgi:hypothetical protein
MLPSCLGCTVTHHVHFSSWLSNCSFPSENARSCAARDPTAVVAISTSATNAR